MQYINFNAAEDEDLRLYIRFLMGLNCRSDDTGQDCFA